MQMSEVPGIQYITTYGALQLSHTCPQNEPSDFQTQWDHQEDSIVATIGIGGHVGTVARIYIRDRLAEHNATTTRCYTGIQHDLEYGDNRQKI
jgi:hypothetical protein